MQPRSPNDFHSQQQLHALRSNLNSQIAAKDHRISQLANKLRMLEKEQARNIRTVVHCENEWCDHNQDKKCTLTAIILELTRDNTMELVCTNLSPQ